MGVSGFATNRRCSINRYKSFLTPFPLSHSIPLIEGGDAQVQGTPKFQLAVDSNNLLAPDSFMVESDANNEVGLAFDGPSESFSLSIASARYHTNDRESRQQIAMHEYSDLNYDQCVSVCLDLSFDCGSFSYCNHQRLCTLINLNNTDEAKKRGLLVEDHDCSIMRRDYLLSFHRIQGTPYPSSYHHQVESIDRNECAEQCLFSKDLQCLGFDFCVETNSIEVYSEDSIRGTCFYQQTRYSLKEGHQTSESPQSNEARRCDHYSRPSLAEYSQLSFRKFIPDIWLNVTPSRYEDKTLSACADLCLNTVDCIGLEFCTKQKAKNKLTHTCIFVESSLEELIGVASAENATRTVADQHMAMELKLNGILQTDIDCRVLMLKERLRITFEPPDEVPANQSNGRGTRAAYGGSSILGMTLLSLTLTSAVAAITCGLQWAEERSLMVRRCLSYPRSLMGSMRLFAR